MVSTTKIPLKKRAIKKTKKESAVLAPLLKKLGREIGARVLVEPVWGVVGQITFKDGRRSYFRYNTLDLNPVGASDVAKDKDYAAFFLKKLGYPVPTSRAFYSPDWAKAIGSSESVRAARAYAKKTGFPLVVKPNSGSQGYGVYFVHTQAAFNAALAHVFQNDKVALVQKPVRGRDYRVVVLDGDVISAYERIPLNVTGDGTSTVAQLLREKQRAFKESGRDTQIRPDDMRIASKLASGGLRFDSIPPANERVYLLDNANLSTGGDSVDVTDSVHPHFARIAASVTRDMGLRLCGVDLLVEGGIENAPKKYCVLEINAGPGLDHYVKSGVKQQRIVEDLYRRVLRHLAGL